MHYRILLVCCLFLMLALSIGTGLAQGGCQDAAGGPIPCPEDDDEPQEPGQPGLPGDRDGDGTPDVRDTCPDTGGHANFGGCPDTDGDNTPDINDQCPTVGGPDTNAGCPGEPPSTEPTVVPTDAAPALLPPLPEEGECVVGTLRNAAVNVRLSPDPDSPVVGTIEPNLTYPVVHIWQGPTILMRRLANPAGWVADSVVRVGGDCSGVPTSDYSDPAAAQGAIPHWGPNGELTFCLPNYDIGEDTCVPDPEAPNGAIPNWGPNGELTFCLPQYDLGEDTCVVLPEAGKPYFDTLGEIVWCIENDLGEEDCTVLDVDESDGGMIVCALKGKPMHLIHPSAATDEPAQGCEFKHKFLLVGEDGLLVLTIPPDEGVDERPGGYMEFPLTAIPCEVQDPECGLPSVIPDLPIAACYYDPVTNPEVEACDTDNLADEDGDSLPIRYAVMFIPFNPDLPFAACYYDPVTNPETEACDTDNLMGNAFDPDLPLAACFYDAVTNPEVEACDTDNLGPLPEDGLPIAACAFNPDLIIQCDDGEDANYPGSANGGVWKFALIGGGEGPMPQTREHILLARQVGVPALMEHSLRSRLCADNPGSCGVETALGGLELTVGGGDDPAISMLLPAVQKVREAAA